MPRILHAIVQPASPRLTRGYPGFMQSCARQSFAICDLRFAICVVTAQNPCKCVLDVYYNAHKKTSMDGKIDTNQLFYDISNLPYQLR